MIRRMVMIGSMLLAVAGLAVVSAWWSWTRTPGGREAGGPVLVEVPTGMTLAAAADTLVARGLLADQRVLLLGARLTGRARALKAGLYSVEPGLSPRDLLDTLAGGRGVQNRVTIPEGLDAAEVASLVGGALSVDAVRFLAVADSLVGEALRAGRVEGGQAAGARLDSLLAVEATVRPGRLHRCDGYLAPDTYLFAAGTRADGVAAHLVETQLARLAEASALAGPGPHTGHSLLVLASIVEAEARRDDERGRIAAVYANRLDRGMRLEADPTVAHLLGKKGKRLFYADLAVASAWNTYRNGGLPPGPIGNPGRASLAAAARPDSACDAFFFVADGADGHVFSSTIQEHEAAVRRFRSLRSAQRRGGD